MKLSIIIPVTNLDYKNLDSKFTEANCLLKNYEIIVVSDGKFDPSVLNFYNDIKDKVTFIFNETPIGIFECRRKGVKAATGDLIWFVDSTDSIVADITIDKDYKTIYGEYDIVCHNMCYTTGNDICNIMVPQANFDTSLNDLKHLNPISTKFISKVYIDNYIGKFIFKKEFIENIYDKIPEMLNFNKFASLYLIGAALKYAKSLKYEPTVIYIYRFTEKYSGEDRNHSSLYLYCLNAENVFDNKSVKKFLKLIDNDPLKIKGDISNYIELLKEYNQTIDEDEDEDQV